MRSRASIFRDSGGRKPELDKQNHPHTMKPKKAIARKRRKRPPRILLKSLLTDKVNVRSVTHHNGVARSLRFLLQNYWRPIQLDDLVMCSGMSRRGLAKAFHLHLGCSPGSVLRHVRIERAKRILVERDLKLKDIAKHCGYRSENTLCIAFQRATGMAPKQFQRDAWLTNYRFRRQAEADSIFAKSQPGEPILVQNRRSLLRF
jgi:AraC-like DNA-binding protein